MNLKQVAALWLGIVIFVLMGLFPPWLHLGTDGAVLGPAGYGFIVARPVNPNVVPPAPPPPSAAPATPASAAPTQPEAITIVVDRNHPDEAKAAKPAAERLGSRLSVAPEARVTGRIRLDFTRLLVQWALVGAITYGLVQLLAYREEE